MIRAKDGMNHGLLGLSFKKGWHFVKCDFKTCLQFFIIIPSKDRDSYSPPIGYNHPPL